MLILVARACLASVVSIYYRIPSDRPSDATWDLLNVSLLTLVELFIGIIVSCMPSFLKVLQHHFSVFAQLRSKFRRSIQSLRASLSPSRNARDSKTSVSQGSSSPTSRKGLWSKPAPGEHRRFGIWRSRSSAADTKSIAYSGRPNVANIAMHAKNEMGSNPPLYGLQQPSTVKTSVSAGNQPLDAGEDRIVLVKDINQHWNSRG